MTLRERGFLSRLAAYLLIPLLVLSPLPGSVQVDLVALPLSLLSSSAEAQEVPRAWRAGQGRFTRHRAVVQREVFCEYPVIPRVAAYLWIPLAVVSRRSVRVGVAVLPVSVLLLSSAGDREVVAGEPAWRTEQVAQDPLGNVTTFTRSEYVAEDGTTGIGPGGGTVRGEGGVELRIPEGALKKGATFKLRLVDPSELPTLFPNAQHETLATSLGAHHGSVLRLEASEGTRLEKEADLVFPLPDFTAVPESERPAKPEDAFYYIHRRVERCADGSATCAPENRIVVFEVIDEARAEGEGASARVVTASPPFAGVIGVMSGALLLYSMSWSYDLSLLGRPRPGLIRGKVLRTEWGSDGAAFKAVPDAHVTGTDAGGVALSSKDGGAFATSQGDGTYALWDYAFTGGTTRIDAALGAESASATAFEVSEGPGIGVYNKVAHANITFPAVEPPPVPPQVEIQVVQESTGSLISGVVVSGTTLQIGFRSNTPETEYTIYGARVAGQELAVRQAQQGDRPGWTHVVAEPFTPTNPGTYTVEAAAAPGVGSPVNTSTTFRVIAEGGSVETDPLSPPKVITARLYPKPNATGVPVTAFLNVAFTEPVRGIPGNVRLLAGELEIPIRISGVTPDGQVIEAISGDHEILTSLTIQPLAGLRYSTAYRLLLASGITDLDLEPKPLEPFELPFTTFGPAGVGGTTDDRNGSAGIVVLGDRAYLTRTNGLVNGNVVVFDITDPVEPVEVAVSEVFAPRPYDIVGEQADTGEKLIAVATGSTNRSKPASVLLFEASTSEVPQFVGAASLTSSAADGFTSRIAIHGGFVYSATVRKGIQGVEIQRAKNTWSGLNSQPNPDFERQKAKTKLNTDGEGFGQDAVVINLPIPLKSNAAPYYLNDIKAADIAGQTMVAVAGEPGLILAQPLISGITYQGRPEREGTRLDWGYALALGRLQDRDVAVVVGRGTVAGAATTLLITLDVSNSQAPLVLGAVSLSAELGALVPVDILLKDSTALVGAQNSTGDQGFVLLVNLADLAMPEVSGRLEGVAGRLALDENGLLYGSARLSTGGQSVNGGVRTAALQSLTYFRRIAPAPFRLVGSKNVEPVLMDIGLVPTNYEVETAEVDVYRAGDLVATLPVTFNSPGQAVLPAGFEFNLDTRYTVRASVVGTDGQRLKSAERALRPSEVEFIWSKEVEVTENGQRKPLDVIKLYDARPRVILDPVTPTGGLRTVVKGKVIDDLAPIPKTLINGREVPVLAIAPPARTSTEEIGPFEGTFTMPFQELVTSLYDQLLRPGSDTAVEYGPEGTLAAVTAVNSLKNVGWDSAWLTPNPNPDGSIPDGSGTFGLGVVEQATVPPVDTRSEYQFRVSIRDRGLADVVTSVQAVVSTGIEHKTVRLERVASSFVSRPLYLVPASFEVATGLDAKTTEEIRSTRIRGKLGTRITVRYLADDVKDEAIVAGVELVDRDGQSVKMVPAAMAAPVITITQVTTGAVPGAIARWQAGATGTVRDPIAAIFPDLVPTVTVNGVPASVTARGAGVFDFSATGARLLPETRVYARAESANGAVGFDYRDVSLTYPSSDVLIPNGAQVQSRIAASFPPDVLKPVYVNVYGPELDARDIAGEIRGAYSIPEGPGVGHWAGELPPSITLSFRDTNQGRIDGVHVYRSEQAIVPVKVPSHRLRQPQTPTSLSRQPLLAVEVGGFAEAKLTAGTLGALRGLTDVSGFELLTPRDGGIVNVSSSMLAANPLGSLRDPVVGVTFKWRGIGSVPQLSDFLPEELSLPINVAGRFTNARLDSITATAGMIARLGRNVFSGQATDQVGYTHNVDAGVFTFNQDMVANESTISPFSADDIAGLALGQGRYYAPDLTDGFDLLIPFGIPDADISDHLRRNGLRAVAMKRNLGSLITVERVDGKSALTESLVAELADVPVPSLAGTLPLREQIIDGEEIRWQDVVDAGYQQAWLDSYQAGPGDIKWPDVAERSAILQRVRAHLGLAQRPNARSAEYQGYIDGWSRELEIQSVLATLPGLPGILRVLFGPVDRFFVTLIRVSASEGRVLEVATAAGVFRQNLILPAIEDTVPAAVSAAVRNGPRVTALVAARNAAKATLRRGAYTAAQKSAAHTTLSQAGGELGAIGLEDYIATRFGSQGTRLYTGMPTSGGGARGIFDEAVEIVLTRDAAGTPLTTKLFIGEAKGAAEAYSIVGKAPGRLIRLQDGREVYALQGTKEYVEGVAVEMASNTTDPAVQAAGLKILAKIQRGAWDELEYAFVVSRWVRRGDRVIGMSDVMQVTRVTLR